jgi:hypothetical protein
VKIGIYARDVRLGDVIQFDARNLITVRAREVRGEKYPEIVITDQNGVQSGFDAAHPLVLLRRPWPKGKTGRDILAAVEACAHRFLVAIGEARAISEGQVGIEHDHRENPQDVLTELREAIEAYELGRPEEPKRNESLVEPEDEPPYDYYHNGEP